MNSSELSALAGVTIRTLRHYHQLGILAEPPRGSNRYRRYSVHDLIRVLRIRRLAALGIPLDQMPGLLDDDRAEYGDTLDKLDAELAARIEALTTQRALIHHLRAAPTAPDMPPELATFFGDLETRSTPELARIEKEQAVLLAHIIGSEGMPRLVGFYEKVSNPALLPALEGTAARFDALRPGTSEHEIESFVESFVETFFPIVESLHEHAQEFDLSTTEGLFAEHTESMLNTAQQRTLSMITSRIDNLLRGD